MQMTSQHKTDGQVCIYLTRNSSKPEVGKRLRRGKLSHLSADNKRMKPDHQTWTAGEWEQSRQHIAVCAAVNPGNDYARCQQHRELLVCDS